MRDIDLIVIHCSATPSSMDIGADTIRDWHVNERGWSDIGYHYVIKRNGRIDEGRPLKKAGAHAKGHNSNSIGVCLVGGIPDANFTLAQYKTLNALLEMLKTKYNNPEIKGHRELDANKTCPCFDVHSLLEYIS